MVSFFKVFIFWILLPVNKHSNYYCTLIFISKNLLIVSKVSNLLCDYFLLSATIIILWWMKIILFFFLFQLLCFFFFSCLILLAKNFRTRINRKGDSMNLSFFMNSKEILSIFQHWESDGLSLSVLGLKIV